jgi:hypothetical protein
MHYLIPDPDPNLAQRTQRPVKIWKLATTGNYSRVPERIRSRPPLMSRRLYLWARVANKMGTLEIAEFASSSHGTPVDPPWAVQIVVLDGAEPAESKPFHKLTRCVRIISDMDCRIAVAPDAASPKTLLRAATPENRIVQGDGFKLYAIAAGRPQSEHGGVASSANTDAVLSLLAVVASAAKSKALIEKIASTEADAKASIAALGDVKASVAALAKEKQQFESERSAEMERMRDARDALAAEREQLKAEQQELARKVDALTADRAKFETARRAHELQLSELGRLKKLLAAA